MPMVQQYLAAVRRFRRGWRSRPWSALSFLALELLVPRVPASWHHTALSLVVLTLALAVWGVFAFTILWIVWARDGKRGSGERK